MLNRRVKLAKIFIAINIIIILILFACAFYGKHIEDYKGVSINGVDDKKNFFELLKVMYFSDKDDYKEASLVVLNEDDTKYQNYSINTTVSIGEPYLFNPNGTRNSKLELYVTSRIDGDIAMGFINISNSDDKNVEYKYYRIYNNRVVETYLLVDDVWYVTKEVGEQISLNINNIISDLKDRKYSAYPERKLRETSATLYPEHSWIHHVDICSCGTIDKICSENGTYKEFPTMVSKSISGNYDEDVAKITDWMESHDCKYHVDFSINDIDKVSVHMPENLSQIAVDGDVYQIIMNELASSAVDSAQNKQ